MTLPELFELLPEPEAGGMELSLPEDNDTTPEKWVVQQHPAVRDFLALTRYTCPAGYEAQLYGGIMRDLGATPDEFGNYWLTVGGGSRTLFAAHLDTADSGAPKRVRHQYRKGNIVATYGDTLLGADDRAGVAVLLHLIRNEVPGTYAFFLGEEVGRQGSSQAHTRMGKGAFERCIMWDRCEYSSIITHQMMEETASSEFAAALVDAYVKAGFYAMEPDDTGSYTDSYSFRGVIPECTNISIGYFNQHSNKEMQDLEYLAYMAEASVLVDWESLPTVREPAEMEWRSLRAPRSWGGSWEDFDDLPPYDGGVKVADDPDTPYWQAQGRRKGEVNDDIWYANYYYKEWLNGKQVDLQELMWLTESEPKDAAYLIYMLMWGAAKQ